MNNEVQVDPNLVIQSLTRQIAEQATKIAMLEAFIEKNVPSSQGSGEKPSE
jgi:hypothetical protein